MYFLTFILRSSGVGEAEVTYNAKRRISRKDPSFRKVFGRHSFLVKTYLFVDFHTGLSDKDYELGSALSKAPQKKTVRLRPMQTKTVKFWVIMDQCHSWPTPTTPEEADYLNIWTGFDTQPPSYPCMPPWLTMGFEAEIKGRYKVFDAYKTTGTTFRCCRFGSLIHQLLLPCRSPTQS